VNGPIDCESPEVLMDPDPKQPYPRFFTAPDGPDESYDEPITLDEIVGCHAAGMDLSDAEDAMDQEIYAGLVAP